MKLRKFVSRQTAKKMEKELRNVYEIERAKHIRKRKDSLHVWQFKLSITSPRQARTVKIKLNYQHRHL